jgi:maltooligosyltrehalose trehalohydrolase
LQRLVDACHRTGLAIYLDVVYNHFGPESNDLAEFGPYYTDRFKSPWGDAVNYDGAGSDAVRDFVLDNVRMWLEEFHIDGLRLDAADTIFDMSAHHILREIKVAAVAAGERRGWPAVVTAETDLNDPRLLYPAERGGFGLDIQWMDDFQHAAFALLTGDQHAYYADFGEPAQLAKVLNQPYVYSGEYSPVRDRKHGALAEGLPGDRFLVFLQNHDQVGNRPRSDRLSTRLKCPGKLRLGASLLLLSPYLPLLFMGEEFGEENPFPFFCSFHGEKLSKNVRDGRRQEFFAYDPTAEVPDPNLESTFASARLSWSWPDGTLRAGLRRLHRDLLTARREWPALRDYDRRSARLMPIDDVCPVLELMRGGDPDGVIRAYYNLEDRPRPIPAEYPAGLTVKFSSEAGAYGGQRQRPDDVKELLAHECLVLGPSSWKSFP